MKNEYLQALREKANNLTMDSGVYFMKDKNGKIIYVGKAKHLKNRVSSYFNGVHSHPRKVFNMVYNVVDFDIIITNTEIEALVLECSQIKHYQPKYNILLKDDKNFPYIKVTLEEDYPRIVFTRRQEDDKNRYFGPYSGNVWGIIETVQKTFKLPSCKKQFPRDIGKGRPCLNFFIKNCDGVCAGNVSQMKYIQSVNEAVEFLSGKYEEIIGSFKESMETASESLLFEEAALYRDKIASLEKLRVRQRVLEAPSVDRDVIAYCEDEIQGALAVFCIRGGKLINNNNFILDKEDFTNRAEGMSAFIKQYFDLADSIPPEILVSDEIEDLTLLEEYFSKKRGKKVSIRIPKIGNLKKSVDMVYKNAQEYLRISTNKEEKNRRSVSELADLLGLESPPLSIEAVDISNTGDSEIVGAIVRFDNGRMNKNLYKRYKIRTTDTQNDYGSMEEVVERRFKMGSESENIPELFLVDGGLGHLTTVLRTLERLGVNIPVFGMVKDDKHKSRGLVGIDIDSGETSEIIPTPVTAAAVLIANIQEEVHRFAVSYHRNRRSKAFNSVLTEIEGVGEKRAREMLIHFKTMENIKAATLEELCEVKGMTKSCADNIQKYFQNVIDLNAKT